MRTGASNYEKRFQIVNKKTGEVVYNVPLGYFPPRFDEERGYLFWNQKSQSAQYADVDFPAEMNMVDRGRLATLAKRIWVNTNCIGKRCRNGSKQFEPCDLDDIGQIIGLSPRYAKEWLDKMIVLGVMALVEVTVENQRDTQYYINPIYYSSSDRLSLNLYLLFRRQLDRHLPEWVRERYAESENRQKQEKPAD